MQILHANWSRHAICLWAESLDRCLEAGRAEKTQLGFEGSAAGAATGIALAEPGLTATLGSASEHPFAIDSSGLKQLLESQTSGIEELVLTEGRFRLRLPVVDAVPAASERLATLIGSNVIPADARLQWFDVPCLRLDPVHAAAGLLTIEETVADHKLLAGHSLRYWIAVARFVIEMLCDQRFIPSVIRPDARRTLAVWQPWLHDEDAIRRLEALLTAMPPVVRAAFPATEDQPWLVLRDALLAMTDSVVRNVLREDGFGDAIADRPASDPNVAWLGGLLGADGNLAGGEYLLRDVSLWISRLDETGGDEPLRLCLRLDEPGMSESGEPDGHWTLTAYLQHEDDPSIAFDAEELWSGAASRQQSGMAGMQPQELMLRELGRASRVYPKLEEALSGSAPQPLLLTTNETFALLSEFRPLLQESGVMLDPPPWWDDAASRLGMRLTIDATQDPPTATEHTAEARNVSSLGLRQLVEYRWNVAIGDDVLTAEQFDHIRRQASPLARVNGRWVVLRPDDLKTASELVEQSENGQAKLGEVVRMAFGMERNRPSLPLLGLDARGWLSGLFDSEDGQRRLPAVDPPKGFAGSLRPYQLNGLRWLIFLESLGFGACLADDMGLGKTIQLIALLLHERENAGDETIDPTLLIVPTSLIANWNREIERFANALRVQIHHGPDRPTGAEFIAETNEHDVVITTYGLVSRDVDSLSKRRWGRVVLDEAQYIKNPPTKQTAAVRGLDTAYRVALTGTPLENRLSELWSIMEFCNPGYLGSAGEFRRLFAVPIERHRDAQVAQRLRQLVQPFVLRRLKTDPKVISDLPECVETKEYATLTKEQAAVYQNVVDHVLADVDRAEGMQRRGMVLAALVKLKQTCDHPELVSGDLDSNGRSLANRLPTADRSGKCQRLLQMLEQVVASGEKALVFTQYRRMGHLLSQMVQHEFDCDALFLHGGTTPKQRQKMIDRFQSGDHRTPVFVLSLKAGGVGLNLTAANHVFHFDRWWNPAVENQATDRAFRIGQVRTVHVHKFVCLGTLEERIDQMLEQKAELSKSIIGSGEQWLTELTTSQLHDMLQLRETAMEVEE